MQEGPDKNTLIAIVMIMIVTFLWIYLSPRQKSIPPVKSDNAITVKNDNVEKVSTVEIKKSKKPEKIQRKQIPQQLKIFENDRYSIVFSNHGATIKSLKLKKFRQELKKDSNPVELFDFNEIVENPIFWKFKLDEEEYKTDIPFEIEQTTSSSIVFKGELISKDKKNSLSGAHVADIYVNYDIGLEGYQILHNVEIVNKLNENLQCSGMLEFYGRANDVSSGVFGLFSARQEPVKAIYNLNDKVKREILEKQAEKTDWLAGDVKWLGFNDKYFMTSVIPDIPSIRSFRFADNRDKVKFYRDGELQSTQSITDSKGNIVTLQSNISSENKDTQYALTRESNELIRGSNPQFIEESSGCFGKKQSVILDAPKDTLIIDDLFSASVQFPLRKLERAGSLTYSTKIYAGPKEISILKSMGKQMDRAIDLGEWIGPISRPLLYFLKWIHSIIPNYGIAIILLTIIVRLLLYPLTHMQNKSMKKMQMLKPELDKLKAKFKDDKESLNREMMKLWKTHKVNPMGGCFPLILQMPIFFALYRVLYNSIELRHAPFAFWIQDLSNYDPYFVTPVLMGLSFFLQQKIMPQGTMDPAQQKMMSIMMPIMFTALMLFLPSGLVIYIFVSTLLGLVQQIINTRSKNPVQKKA